MNRLRVFIIRILVTFVLWKHLDRLIVIPSIVKSGKSLLVNYSSKIVKIISFVTVRQEIVTANLAAEQLEKLTV